MAFLTAFYLIILIIVGYSKAKTIFNPLSLFSCSISTTLVSVALCDYLGLLRFASISDIDHLYFALLLGGLGFFSSYLLIDKSGYLRRPISLIESAKKPLIFFGILGFLGISLASVFLGGLPLISMIGGILDVNDLNDRLNMLPFGVMAVILNCAIIFFILLPEYISTRKELDIPSMSILLFIVFLFCFWQGKRQAFLFALFIMGAFYLNYVRLKFSFKTIGLAVTLASLLIVFFTLFGNIRNNISFEDRERTPEIIEYAMYAPMNFASILNSFPRTGASVYPKSILLEILPSRLVDQSSKNFKDYLFEPTSPSGYFAYWYMDWGYYGVFLGGLLLGITSFYFYFNSFKSLFHRRANLLTLWCCATVGVYNHFISLNFFWLPLLIVALISFKYKFKW